MRISNIQPYALNNNALKTHPEKFASKSVNNYATDSVSFKGRGFVRTTSFLLGALAALTSVFGLSAAKANALSSAPGDTPNLPPFEPEVIIGCTEEDIFGPSANKQETPVPSMPPQGEDIVIGCTFEDIFGTSSDIEAPKPETLTPPVVKPNDNPWEKYDVTEVQKEAKDAREFANKALQNAEKLEAEAKRASYTAYLSKETKETRNILKSAVTTTVSIKNYTDMTDLSVNMVQNYLEKVESAIENGDLKGKKAEEAQELIDEIRNGIAKVQVASEGAAKSASGLENKAAKTSKLEKDLIDAAKDGVHLGTLPRVKESAEETKTATETAQAELKALKASFEGMIELAGRLQTVSVEAVSPVPLRAPLQAPPIFDTFEDLTGQTDEQREADIAKGQAQMAKILAVELVQKAEKLEEKLEALLIIAEASDAKDKAEEAAEKLEALKAELDAANAAAADSRDAVEARLAGRSAINNDVYLSDAAVVDLKNARLRARALLNTAKEAGIDASAIANLENALAGADDVIENTEAAGSATKDAAWGALNSKNKKEADAALKELNLAKSSNTEAIEAAKAKIEEINAEILKLSAVYEDSTGKVWMLNMPPLRTPNKVTSCGSLEIGGKTEEEIAAKKAEADYVEAKRQAQIAQTRLEVLQKDAERAKVILLLLESEEVENE